MSIFGRLLPRERLVEDAVRRAPAMAATFAWHLPQVLKIKY